MRSMTTKRALNLLIATLIVLTVTTGTVAAQTPVALCQGEGLTDATVRGIFQTAGNSVDAYCHGMHAAEFSQADARDTTQVVRESCQGEGLTDATVRSIFEATGGSC